MNRIEIRFIPESEQRYATLGDWTFQGETLLISASGDTQDEQFLVALHELVEAYLCDKHGVNQDAVDEFDMSFEDDGEPGDSSAAPYRVEHRDACLVEHIVARFLGLTDYGVVR
jgi:hypothetical protein